MFSGVTRPSYKHEAVYADGDNVRYEARYNKYKNMSLSNAMRKGAGYNPKVPDPTGGLTTIIDSFGYKLSAYFFANMGLPFGVFLAVLFLVGSYLCFTTFREITDNYSYILMLYFGYYFLYDIQQIRNFMGVSIVIFSIRYLFRNQKSKFFIGICIASLFHVTMFVFLLFLAKDLPIINKHGKKFIKYIAIFSVGMAVLNIAGVNIIKTVASVFYSGDYISNTFSPVRPFIEIAQCAYFAYLSIYLHEINPQNKVTEVIYKLNVVSFIFLPLILISMTMDRLIRPILLLNYALFANETELSLCVNKHDIRRFGILIVVGAMTLAFSRTMFIWIFDSNKLLALLGV